MTEAKWLAQGLVGMEEAALVVMVVKMVVVAVVVAVMMVTVEAGN